MGCWFYRRHLGCELGKVEFGWFLCTRQGAGGRATQKCLPFYQFVAVLLFIALYYFEYFLVFGFKEKTGRGILQLIN